VVRPRSLSSSLPIKHGLALFRPSISNSELYSRSGRIQLSAVSGRSCGEHFGGGPCHHRSEYHWPVECHANRSRNKRSPGHASKTTTTLWPLASIVRSMTHYASRLPNSSGGFTNATAYPKWMTTSCSRKLPKSIWTKWSTEQRHRRQNQQEIPACCNHTQLVVTNPLQMMTWFRPRTFQPSASSPPPRDHLHAPRPVEARQQN
jgi:hypothetical protein